TGGEEPQHAPMIVNARSATARSSPAMERGGGGPWGHPRRPATAPPVGGPPGLLPRLLRRGDAEREAFGPEHEGGTVPRYGSELEPFAGAEGLVHRHRIDDAVDLDLGVANAAAREGIQQHDRMSAEVGA